MYNDATIQDLKNSYENICDCLLIPQGWFDENTQSFGMRESSKKFLATSIKDGKYVTVFPNQETVVTDIPYLLEVIYEMFFNKNLEIGIEELISIIREEVEEY